MQFQVAQLESTEAEIWGAISSASFRGLLAYLKLELNWGIPIINFRDHAPAVWHQPGRVKAVA
jgi:hypothetical protein